MKKIVSVLLLLATAALAQFPGPPAAYPRVVADTISDTSLVLMQVPSYGGSRTTKLRSMTFDQLTDGVAARIDSLAVTCNAGLNCDSTGTGDIVRKDSASLTGYTTVLQQPENPPTGYGAFLSEYSPVYSTDQSGTQHGNDLWSFPTINTGVTHSGSHKGFVSECLRNNLVGADDNGTMSGDLDCNYFLVGHGAAGNSSPISSNVFGIYVKILAQAGTIGVARGIRVDSPDTTGGGVVGRSEPLYLEDTRGINTIRGCLGVGGEECTSVFSVSRDTNSNALGSMRNFDGGTGAAATWAVLNDVGLSGSLQVFSSGFTPSGLYQPNDVSLNATQRLVINTDGPYGIVFGINDDSAGYFSNTGLFSALKGFAASGLNDATGPTFSVSGASSQPAYIYLYGDNGEDDADKVKFGVGTDGEFKVFSRASGSDVKILGVTGAGNVSFAGGLSLASIASCTGGGDRFVKVDNTGAVSCAP